jgi:hypothetical protein
VACRMAISNVPECGALLAPAGGESQCRRVV